MKNLVLLSALFIYFTFNAISQEADKDVDKKELENLLNDRKAKFDSYSVSLEKRSGIFGNKTKNDIKSSNEVLINIVQTDNRIISKLYHLFDLGDYKKVTMSYDIQQREVKLAKLVQATDTLSKQVETLKNANHSLQSGRTRLKWLVYILSFFLIWMLVSRRKKNRLKQDITSTVE